MCLGHMRMKISLACLKDSCNIIQNRTADLLCCYCDKRYCPQFETKLVYIALGEIICFRDTRLLILIQSFLFVYFGQ